MKMEALPLSGISPGSYELWASGTGSALAVMQMKATGAVIDGHILKVGTQSATVTATLAEGTATLSGFARRDGKPVAGGHGSAGSSQPDRRP